MFQLTDDEWDSLKSQIVTSNEGRGGRRSSPYVFTEQGVAMLSGVLNSKKAIDLNIQIMRAFVQFREMLLSSDELHKRLNTLESKYDEQFSQVFQAIRQLMLPPDEQSEKGRIGFRTED